MANYKNSRMAEDIKRELTAILRDIKDPRVDKLLTIVRADLSGDMSTCKVFVSSLGGIEKTKESVKGLKSAAGYIRRELGRSLSMRAVPELRFVADNSIAHSAEINKILGTLEFNDEETEEEAE